MSKTPQVLAELVRNPKHHLRDVDSRPHKSYQNRYERRKVKEYLRVGHWLSED